MARMVIDRLERPDLHRAVRGRRGAYFALPWVLETGGESAG